VGWGGEGGDKGQGVEMAQTMYAHMNKQIKRKKKNEGSEAWVPGFKTGLSRSSLCLSVPTCKTGKTIVPTLKDSKD
jgi:hypothetical protein